MSRPLRNAAGAPPERMPDRRDLLTRAVSFNNQSAFASKPALGGRTSSANDVNFETKKLAIVMVGLPARGKSHIARCLERYLNWLGFTCAVFNVGSYRRRLTAGRQNALFFDPTNEDGLRKRMELAVQCLNDMADWFDRGGLVGIYDATNSTMQRRAYVRNSLEACGARVLFLESACTDAGIIERNIADTKLHSPDYTGTSPEVAAADFKRRIAMYEQANEPVSADEHASFIRVVDVGRQLVLHDIRGYLQGKIVSFLLNTHISSRRIYLSRHGESEWNVSGLLGGDAPLTARGRAYATALAKFAADEFKVLPLVWTSQLRRARETVEQLPAMSVCWRALNEIDAGVCEGLTYAEVAERYPDVARERQRDKLNYRYPGGESYVDVIHRLEPAILELERHRGDILVVAHNAVIRAIYAYYSGKSQRECPLIDVPLHTIFKLTTRAYGVEEERINLDVKTTEPGA